MNLIVFDIIKLKRSRSKENIINAYKKFLNNYTNFNGRSSRSDYWYVFLANFLIGFIGGLIPALAGLTALLSSIYSLAVLIPGIALFIRRMHDINKSGWNFFWSFVPVVGLIILLVFLCKPSVDENNRYGSLV